MIALLQNAILALRMTFGEFFVMRTERIIRLGKHVLLLLLQYFKETVKLAN